MTDKNTLLRITRSFILIAFIMLLILFLSSFSYDVLNAHNEKVILKIEENSYEVAQIEDIPKLIARHRPAELLVKAVDEQGNIVDDRRLDMKEISVSYISEQEWKEIEYVLEKNKFRRFFGKLKRREFDRLLKPFAGSKAQEHSEISQLVISADQMTYDEKQLKSWVLQNIRAMNRKMRPAFLAVEGGQIVQMPPQNGVFVDMATAMDKITRTIVQNRESAVDVPALVMWADGSNIPELLTYTKILGHTSAKVNPKDDPNVLIATEEVIDVFLNKSIAKGARFSLHGILSEISQNPKLQGEEFRPVQKEFRSLLAKMMYSSVKDVRLESVVYWDENLTVGDTAQLLPEEAADHEGLVFVNSSPYDILLSAWHTNNDELNIALIGRE